MPRASTPHSMMQRRTRDIAFQMNGEVIDCTYPYEIEESLKVEKNKPGVWDLLGQPSRKFNYKVKYSAPPSVYVLVENIVPSRWGEEFDEEDGIISIVQPPNPRVMKIDIWYDSDEEVIDAQEQEGSKIIVWNKKNNTKVAS